MALNKTFIYFYLFLIFFISGCSFIASFFVKSPEVTGINNVALTEISLTEIEFVVSLDVMNYNSFSAEVKKAQYKVYLNNEYLGNGFTERSQTLANNKISKLDLPLRIKYIDLPSNTITLIKEVLKGNKIKYKVEGDADVEAEGFSATVSIDIEKELTASKN